MDPWEHEDRFSFGGGSPSPSRPLRNRDHDQLLIWRSNLFLGDDRERNEPRRDGNNKKNQENHIDDAGDRTGKPVAKARPKQTSMPTTSSSTVTLPYHQRDWIDFEPGQYDKSCFEVSKKMIRLLRHDPSILREEDGAVEFRILAPMFRSEFTFS